MTVFLEWSDVCSIQLTNRTTATTGINVSTDFENDCNCRTVINSESVLNEQTQRLNTIRNEHSQLLNNYNGQHAQFEFAYNTVRNKSILFNSLSPSNAYMRR